MKEKNKVERYAERWFSAHGFKWNCVKQYNSKTVYEISKDGLEYKWELPFGVTDPKKYMELACEHNHEMMIEIERHKGALEGAKNDY